jgi:DNA-binding SARP family transcriptional activator
MAITFLVLGEVDVRWGAHHPGPPSTMVRGLLGALLLRANRFVPVRQLSRELWNEPPASAESNLRTYASRLRRALGTVPEGTGTLADRLTAWRGSGYRITVGPDELDLSVFTGLARTGRVLLREGRYPGAVARCAEALALWRGAAGVDVPRDGYLGAQLRALNDSRLAVRGDLVEARLALGDTDGLRAELTALVAAYPTRERGYGQLMRLLYRDGDPSGAVAVYQRLRSQLGIEPGPELRHVYQAVVRRDDGAMSVPATGRLLIAS